MHLSFLKPILLFLLLGNTLVFAQKRSECDSLIERGITSWRIGKHPLSLSYLQKALVAARDNNWYKQEFRALNNIGANYHSLLMYGEALDHYLESYKIALEHLTPAEEMVVMNNIAIIYSEEGNFNKAKEYFTKAYNLAKSQNIRKKMGIYQLNIGQLAIETHNYGEAKRYIETALPLLREDPYMYLNARLLFSISMLHLMESGSAQKEALSLLPLAEKFSDIKISLLQVIAQSYLQQHNYEQSLHYIRMIPLKLTNENDRKIIFDMLSQNYANLGQANKALLYKDSVIFMIEKIDKAKNKSLLKSNEVRLNLEEYKNKVALQSEKTRSQQKTYLAIISSFICIAAIIIMILYNRSVRQKQKQLNAEKRRQEIELDLEREKNEHLLLEKILQEKEATAIAEILYYQQELEVSNRKISSKSLYIANRNELIEDVIDELEKIPEINRSRTVSGHIKTLKKYLAGGKEWESFLTHFEQVNHQFISALKYQHPDLTANDIRFLSYIYMNMNTKEIAALLEITDDACRKRKERLRIKLELEDANMLYSYLYSLK